MLILAGFLMILAVPLAIINSLGWITSGVWLAILGEWAIIGIGILALFASSWGIGLAMLPGIIFQAPAFAMLKRGNKIRGYFFGFLSTIYTIAVLTAWCIGVLANFTKQANVSSMVPVLIWSYFVALCPIAWAAH